MAASAMHQIWPRSCLSKDQASFEVVLKKLIFELKRQNQNELAKLFEAKKSTVRTHPNFLQPSVGEW